MIIDMAIFGVLSSICIMLGLVPYLHDIHSKKVQPHVLSWAGWGLITALGASAMYAEGSMWVVGIVIANSFACFLIALFSLVKRVGVWQTSWLDWVLFVAGLVGLLLWQLLDMPVLALVCAILADFAFGVPTIIKTYKSPNSETTFPWAMSSLAGLSSLFAIEVFAFHEVAYPLYLFIYDTTIFLLIVGVVGKRGL